MFLYSAVTYIPDRKNHNGRKLRNPKAKKKNNQPLIITCPLNHTSKPPPQNVVKIRSDKFTKRQLRTATCKNPDAAASSSSSSSSSVPPVCLTSRLQWNHLFFPPREKRQDEWVHVPHKRRKDGRVVYGISRVWC